VTPEQVVTYFSFVAEQVREILAGLGARTLDEIIGRAELLERVERPEVPRAQMLDLSMLLTEAKPGPETAVKRTIVRNDRPGVVYLDDEILEECRAHIGNGLPFSGFYDIRTHHLAVGARVAGAIATRHGDAGLPAGHMHLRFRGSAGQSFGAFASGCISNSRGNDYVGKGLSGRDRVARSAGGVRQQHHETPSSVAPVSAAPGGRLFQRARPGHFDPLRRSR
jgi:glutamate synthase domain-containing protein 3